MKIRIMSLLLLFLAGARLGAQERPPYGQLSIAAVSPTPSGLQIAGQLSMQIANVMRQEKSVTIMAVIPPRLVRDATDEALLKLAGNQVNWLAIVNFEPKDQQHGVYNVEVMQIVTGKIVSRISAWFGRLATVGDTAAEVVRVATVAALEIITYVSQLKVVHVIFRLRTCPGDADYILGNAGVRHIPPDGIDIWDTIRPIGPTSLRVMKTGFADAMLSIVIPSPSEKLSYVIISQTVEFEPCNH